MNGFIMQNNEFWRHYWRFIDVLNIKVISIAEHVLILNKIQVEENVSAFNTIFGIDIKALNVSNHNGTLSAYHFLDLKLFCTQQISFDRNFTFIYHALTVYY